MSRPRFTYNLVDHRVSEVLFDVTCKIKLPTADERKGLGTGDFDCSLQGNA